MTAAWQAHESMPGVETLRLGDPTHSTLRDSRKVRAQLATPQSLKDWPLEQRALVKEWVQRTRSATPRWAHLLDWAGMPRHQLAVDVLLGLLLRGWIEIEEITRLELRGSWQAKTIIWRDLAGLRAEVGLADPAAEKARTENLRWWSPDDERLLGLGEALTGSTRQTLAARRELCDRLEQWLMQSRKGTRRDFGLFARSHSKSVSPSEWQWLAENVDLVACGITTHPPVFTLGGVGELVFSGGPLLIHALPAGEYMSVTVEALHKLLAVEGVKQISVIENLTSFGNALKQPAPHELIIWMPGYVAPWWKSAALKLLGLAHVPVRIACDCDPWGIALTLQMADIVEKAGCEWSSWRMSAATLDACQHRQSLSDADRRKLDMLLQSPLPRELAELARHMLRIEQKAEQEQYL